MKKNLGIKTAIIIVTLLVFVWGIFFGTNPEASMKAFKEKGPLAAMQENIHLGLDLRGGTHLILQVAVDEAVGAESDRTAERLKDELAKKNIKFTDVSRGSDPAQVVVKGVPADQVGEARSIVTEEMLDHDVASSAEGDLLVTMKPLALTQLKNNTVSRSIETIRGRVDALGVSEPVIQEHGLGEHQILVQLPGVDDPVRVRQIMQETGMLEYRLALRPNPFPTEQEALASFNGTLPPNAEILPDGTRSGNGGFWVVTKNAVVSGDDIRSATPGTSETGQSEVSFNLKAAAGKRFAAFTSTNIGNPLAVVLNRKVRQVATIQSEMLCRPASATSKIAPSGPRLAPNRSSRV
jgi:preprotein translocase subunit SecD